MFKEIGLRFQILITTLHSLVNTLSHMNILFQYQSEDYHAHQMIIKVPQSR